VFHFYKKTILTMLLQAVMVPR